MKLDDFKRILSEYGIRYHDSGQSIVLQDCPSCGSRDFKVRLRVVNVSPYEPFFGRCQRGRCMQGYSSISYLLKMNVPRSEVLAAHGLDPVASIKSLVPTTKDFSEALHDDQEKDLPKDTDISKFFKISDWPNHPASKYAISRGVTPEQYDFVLIDQEINAVVFVCYEDGVIQGYQKRFVKPTNPKLKTKSSIGFKKTKELLTFHRNADILVCEGPFTALSAWHYGYCGICTFGSGMSAEQIDKIVKLADKMGKQIGIAYEDDEAGRLSYDRLRRALYWLDRELFIIKPETGKDLNDSWMAGKGVVSAYSEAWGGPAVPTLEMF